jgi:hypothetical protein
LVAVLDSAHETKQRVPPPLATTVPSQPAIVRDSQQMINSSRLRHFSRWRKLRCQQTRITGNRHVLPLQSGKIRRETP